MKIALMLQSDGPGGAERMLLQMAVELRERGHSVCPVGPSDGCGWLADQFRGLGYEPETFTNRRMLDWQCVRGLRELFRRRSIDLVHSHEFGLAVYGAAACAFERLPHVITLHGDKYYDTRARRRAALRWAAKRSRALVAVSNATAKHLEASLRLPPGAVHVVNNGINFEPGDRASVRRELGMGDDEVLIVAVGNLYPVKGHDVLLEALGRLSSGSSVWRLAIAGRGDAEGPLRALADQAGIAERVHFLGYRADVSDILAAGDVYAMPSRSEGMPLALLEAMFSRRAIVASDVGGIPEVVEAGESALLAPPEDAERLAAQLDRLIGDPALRDRLATAAYRRAQHRFSAAAMIDSYEALYGRVPG